jgi:hypothetical protein
MEDDDKETPIDPPPPADPPHVPPPPVTREEFDGLKATIDGLTETIARMVPPEPQEDVSPGGVPWTHRGSRRQS